MKFCSGSEKYGMKLCRGSEKMPATSSEPDLLQRTFLAFRHWWVEKGVQNGGGDNLRPQRSPKMIPVALCIWGLPHVLQLGIVHNPGLKGVAIF